jgi:thymidine kinase
MANNYPSAERTKSTDTRRSDSPPLVKHIGHITLFTGTMFSGKSNALIDAYFKHRIPTTVCVIKNALDIKRSGKGHLKTHDKHEIPALALASLPSTEDQLKDAAVYEELRTKLQNCHEILIDEGHFFDNIHQAAVLFSRMGIDVKISALTRTYQGKCFGSMDKMLFEADTVITLHTKCRLCARVASHSHRIVRDTEVVLVGGDDAYMALCKSCFYYINPQFVDTAATVIKDSAPITK